MIMTLCEINETRKIVQETMERLDLKFSFLSLAFFISMLCKFHTYITYIIFSLPSML